MVGQGLAAALRAEKSTAESKWLRSARFSDISEVEELFSPHAECVQLTLAPFSGEAVSLKTGAVSVVDIKSDNSYQLRHQTAEGHLAIGYNEGARAMLVCARNCNPKEDLLLSRGSAVDASILGQSETVWIDVDLASVPELRPFVPEHAEWYVLTAGDGRAHAELRGYVSAAMSMCFADPLLLEDDSMRRRIEIELISRIAQALRKSAVKPGPSKREQKMYALAQRVETFMWDNMEERITLARICRSANCRTRSAIYCFKDLFGLGPITYLKIRRLDAVHQRLKESDGNLRIIDVAADYGFWHMGHFSADYKRMFGKTASETVNGAAA